MHGAAVGYMSCQAQPYIVSQEFPDSICTSGMQVAGVSGFTPYSSDLGPPCSGGPFDAAYLTMVAFSRTRTVYGTQV